ncbi:unnamed protein product [Amoebophrya sp. A120]|nr:unnamed protein product [Amoebophrya sp. A120]|eukprot:GSA120T00008164001.1
MSGVVKKRRIEAEIIEDSSDDEDEGPALGQDAAGLKSGGGVLLGSGNKATISSGAAAGKINKTNSIKHRSASAGQQASSSSRGGVLLKGDGTKAKQSFAAHAGEDEEEEVDADPSANFADVLALDPEDPGAFQRYREDTANKTSVAQRRRMSQFGKIPNLTKFKMDLLQTQLAAWCLDDRKEAGEDESGDAHYQIRQLIAAEGKTRTEKIANLQAILAINTGGDKKVAPSAEHEQSSVNKKSAKQAKAGTAVATSESSGNKKAGTAKAASSSSRATADVNMGTSDVDNKVSARQRTRVEIFKKLQNFLGGKPSGTSSAGNVNPSGSTSSSASTARTPAAEQGNETTPEQAKPKPAGSPSSSNTIRLAEALGRGPQFDPELDGQLFMSEAAKRLQPCSEKQQHAQQAIFFLKMKILAENLRAKRVLSSAGGWTAEQAERHLKRAVEKSLLGGRGGSTVAEGEDFESEDFCADTTGTGGAGTAAGRVLSSAASGATFSSKDLVQRLSEAEYRALFRPAHQNAEDMLYLAKVVANSGASHPEETAKFVRAALKDHPGVDSQGLDRKAQPRLDMSRFEKERSAQDEHLRFAGTKAGSSAGGGVAAGDHVAAQDIRNHKTASDHSSSSQELYGADENRSWHLFYSDGQLAGVKFPPTPAAANKTKAEQQGGNSAALGGAGTPSSSTTAQASTGSTPSSSWITRVEPAPSALAVCAKFALLVYDDKFCLFDTETGERIIGQHGKGTTDTAIPGREVQPPALGAEDLFYTIPHTQPPHAGISTTGSSSSAARTMTKVNNIKSVAVCSRRFMILTKDHWLFCWTFCSKSPDLGNKKEDRTDPTSRPQPQPAMSSASTVANNPPPQKSNSELPVVSFFFQHRVSHFPPITALGFGKQPDYLPYVRTIGKCGTTKVTSPTRQTRSDEHSEIKARRGDNSSRDVIAVGKKESEVVHHVDALGEGLIPALYIYSPFLKGFHCILENDPSPATFFGYSLLQDRFRANQILDRFLLAACAQDEYGALRRRELQLFMREVRLCSSNAALSVQELHAQRRRNLGNFYAAELDDKDSLPTHNDQQTKDNNSSSPQLNEDLFHPMQAQKKFFVQRMEEMYLQSGHSFLTHWLLPKLARLQGPLVRLYEAEVTHPDTIRGGRLVRDLAERKAKFGIAETGHYPSLF